MSAKSMLITGGAGFIGTNAAEAFIHDGWRVIIFDNLSRAGTNVNLQWLLDRFPAQCEFVRGDIRFDRPVLNRLAARCDAVLHLAAQVAVTSSVVNPEEDFEINARGTLNVLEAIRQAPVPPRLIYASTNKVYGSLENVALVRDTTRYRATAMPNGISEEQPLDFHSPYGCSKGAADQYVRDYNRIYRIPTVVFRQSCIYGPHQFGIEDQGWVAWFTIAALLGKPVTIYGDGLQVRDVLHVHDLVRAYQLALENPFVMQGGIYNIGGGPENTVSVLELVYQLEARLGTKVAMAFAEPRPGDQRIFVSDVRKLKWDLGWKPEISPDFGVETLVQWAHEHMDVLQPVLYAEPALEESQHV
jgi:CDP-paratose 2-epimerase